MKLSRLIAMAFASAALTVGAATQPVAAADNPYERGPNPTNSSIEASRGPFAVSTKTISSLSARGFGGGTIYYPTSTSEGTFGVVAVSPGYTAGQSTISWLGPRIASQGFVVITIDTNSRFDQPGSRGNQLLAALDQTIADTTVRGRIDASRQAVMGHSMGGGGTLEAAKSRRSLEATIGMTPWNLDKSWPEVEAASLEIGAQNDSVAPPRSHAIPFYESLTNAERRAYLELRGASHFAPNTSNTTIAKYSIAWLKRYVDDDTRYEQFITPGPTPSISSGVSAYRID
ncbi:poly(ethylene terephthalate) hydrolase family protein [Aeromicrobium duanguangcaii]|uniref:Alpha/beta hydrolase n=1 Tax=Aeromicrobium duanguangcaii TaxID=2968086 RepID=A0ABY5KDL4_9ACTN|nr:alpha/beta hydrolase [Aeromicrobium duanguangcaii]MCD9154560.1 alpha/beta hydrolase [Aeromicrobium duanguangcaii]UUI68384.1 alpha/beta hydrolase [Aeromicrobium duanguangcaii]